MAVKLTNVTWTNEEVQILVEKYPKSKVMDISLLLPNHTKISVYAKARRLGLKHSNPHSWEHTPEFNRRLGALKLEYYRTHDAPFKGKTHTPETRELLKQATIQQFSHPEARAAVSEKMTQYYSDPEHIRALSERQIERFKNPLNREAMRKTSKERFNDPEFLEKYHHACQKKPNKLEQRIINIIKCEGLPFSYNGDFSQGVALNCKIPDFINTNGKKQVIEVFGNYWHQHKDGPEFNYLNEKSRIESYREIGFDCLVLCEHDIKKMTDNKIGEAIKSFYQEVCHYNRLIPTAP